MDTPQVYGVKIIGIGIDDLGPDTVLTNEELASQLLKRRDQDLKILERDNFDPEDAKRYETDDQWIQTRIQIRERRIAPDAMATSDLAIQAGRNALAHANIKPEQIGSLRLATVTPDEWASPPTVSRVAHGLGIPVWDIDKQHLHELIACDHMLACSSYVAALQDAVSDIMLGRCNYALVIGADKMSTITDWRDRSFCSIFGDGAGAMVIKRVPYEESDFLINAFYAGGDGSYAKRIITPVGGSRQPLTQEIVLKDKLLRSMKLQMEGGSVFRELVNLLKRHIIPEALEKSGYSPGSMDIIFPHQANGRMIDAFEKPLRELGFTGFISKTIDRYGNTTSGSVPLGIMDAYESKILLPGRKVMIIVMGGGYSWRVVCFRWSLI